MADEEFSEIVATSEERPQTAHKDRRKVPGGFGADDNDDLSPDKPEFEDSMFANANAHAHNKRIPSLDPASLPSLPPPTDSSLLYSPSENGENRSEGHMDELDEKAMQMHLNDVESSFLPAVSPIGMTGKKGADDTYLFDGAPGSKEGSLSPLKEMSTPAKDTLGTDSGENAPFSPPTPPNAYRTPAPERADPENLEGSMEAGNTTSSLETMSSSPTAAAAARTVSRAISIASMGGYETADDTGLHANTDEEDLEATPRKITDGSSDSRHTLRHHLSNHSLNDNFSTNAGSTPGVALLNRRSSGKRPKFLRSRHTSQRSSVSSFITNPDSQDGSDVTLGADYALQSGGAVPAGGFSRNSSMALSRTISLGSMASGIEDFNGNADSGRTDGSLATLTEEEQNRDRKANYESSPPETPRLGTRSLAAPTDTIIARHVRDVQVPESLAREYRNKNGASSPNKKSGYTASPVGRSGRNLTLKEQSSTIERLSKENFDLKLKVHFLSERLDKLSEEGVKEMSLENVELKTGLAVMQRDSKALKRKIKELEKQLKDDEQRPNTAETTNSGGSQRWFDQEGAQEREEELLYLRERVEEYVTEIEKLRNESVQRESDKRNLAEVVRSMGERRGQNVEVREEMDVWKDLLEQETARREQGDEENKKLREEIFRFKTETTSGPNIPGLNHTTNIYHITKKRQLSPSRPRSELSDRFDDRTGTFSAASTLVEELKKESEQLRHENAELRREVGAQTSMLTSRNREKERLYQEIEDLKLGQRRGGSVAGESIFERSASRAHERSLSRASAGTRQTNLEDEREGFENKQAELRDHINSLKIQNHDLVQQNHDLQRELDSCMEDFETTVEQKKQAEALAAELQEALETAETDLLTMQSDRDEALQGQEEAEIMFESLRKEAQEELDGFAVETEEANAEIERLQGELADTTENFNALQNEMRSMSEGLVTLEDDHEINLRRIPELKKDIEDANHELEQMEKDLVEANEKINRLSVQQESSQSEIAFLREEQDGDKIKIGDLEAAVRHSVKDLKDEQERSKELAQRLANERHQREVVAGKEKQEVQQLINSLNRQVSSAKDDAEKLRRSSSKKVADAAASEQRLTELENNLREALGELDGTRSGLLNVRAHDVKSDILFTFLQKAARLTREVEINTHEIDTTKTAILEKERMIKQRDTLLESHGLESRKLADMLDKERQAHRNTKHQYETFQKTQQHATRTLSQQESRVIELETSRQQDRRKLAAQEGSFKDQLNERNNLLLALWNRLSALCGTDWAHNNSLINGRALPSLEAVTNMLPGFSKNLLAAVKTLEILVGDFKSRVRSVEKDLWKEYHALESNLEIRTKRLDRLETMARSAVPGAAGDGRAEIAKLKDINKGLKTALSTLRAANEVRNGVYGNDGSPSPSVPTGPRHKASDRTRTSTLTRTHSSSAVETLERGLSTRSGSRAGSIEGAPARGSVQGEDYDPRWLARLKDYEYKLKAEREGRTLDNHSAAQRLQEEEREKAKLSAEIGRLRMQNEMQRSQQQI